MPDTAPLSSLTSLRRRLDTLPVEPSQVLAAAVVTVVAVVGGLSWLAAGHGKADGPPPEASLPVAGAVEAEPGTAAAKAGSEPEELVVHVSGAVSRPGLVRLPPGTRVADAIEAAGGATGDADLDRLNLAARVADGERVHMPRRGEVAPIEVTAIASSGSSGSSAPVDLNTATVEQLDTLPGVGPATARAIVEFRAKHGRFRSVTQLLEVRGIGPAKLAELRPRVRV